MEIVLNTSKTSKKIPHGIKSRKLIKSRKHNDKKVCCVEFCSLLFVTLPLFFLSLCFLLFINLRLLIPCGIFLLVLLVFNTISISEIIPLYNIYSTYIKIRLVETIPRDIYQNIVFPSQQHRISVSTISYFSYSKFARFNALVI
jgi:hypothetical protein